MQPTVDYRALFEASPNPYMLLDRELRYVAANAAYLAVTHTARVEDLLGRHVLEAFPDDPSGQGSENARRVLESFRKVLATGRPDVLPVIPYRVPVETPEGRRVEEHLWSATHTPVLDARGEVQFILQHTVNVSELRRSSRPAPPESDAGGAGGDALASGQVQAEAGVLGRALKVQERVADLDSRLRWLRRVFEQAPGFMCVLRGPDHVFELANAAYYELIGGREIAGMPLREALPEIASQGFCDLLDRVLATGEAYVGSGVRAELRRSPGAPLEERYLDFVYQPILDGAGRVAGVFVQGNDVTVQHRLAAERAALLEREQAARAEAEAANRAKDEFLATMSHELRTPLNAVLGWTRMLRTGALPEGKRGRALETIERNARSQLALIEDVLDVSRIVAGKLRLNLADVEVLPLVEAALETARPAADERRVALEARLDPEAGAVSGDANRLQQVVGNLLSNAVKFTPAGGRVRLELRREGDWVEVVVSDDGQGIAAEFLPHVFERFRQADGSAARAHGGLGLGLAIAKHLVELHGGTIRAESGGAGRGATFTVRVPTAARRACPLPPAAGAGAPVECPPALRGMAVLVLEDDRDARELLRELLAHCGAAVRAVASAPEGMEVLRRERPGLLVSDIGLPGEDGYAFIRRVRALDESAGGRTPAVALTAFAHSDDRARALAAGFDDHVSKPVEPAALFRVLGRLLAARYGTTS